ncbi:MAG: hypothetical protein C4554_11695 [Dethiobacter sp.]|jgi:methylmalonyl-CoA epimerase|nr:MAG: hypothetical protein C4554_11695 [Dethiobacter sp.]
MIKKIDHVGIIGKSSQELVELFSRLFGFREVKTIKDARQSFMSRLIIANDAGIEVISPTGTEGSIAKFLSQKGGGLHHISLEVDNIEKEVDRLLSSGIRFVNSEPNRIDNLKVMFIHPQSAHGLLIELVEKGD